MSLCRKRNQSTAEQFNNGKCKCNLTHRCVCVQVGVDTPSSAHTHALSCVNTLGILERKLGKGGVGRKWIG